MVMNLYVFVFSMSVLPKIHFYLEEKRQPVFVVFFQIIRTLLMARSGIRYNKLFFFYLKCNASGTTSELSVKDS